jgi:hypothetical protein
MRHFYENHIIILTILFLTSCQEQNSSETSVEKESKGEMDNKPSIPRQKDSVTNYQERKLVDFVSKHNFSTYSVKVYKGAVADPDFSTSEFSSDQEYVAFIKNGCKENGINFGGHYTIIERGCGAMCSHIFLIDRISGKIFTDIKPNDGRWGYLYKIDSRLLIANSETFTDSTLTAYSDAFAKPELYEWNGKEFELLE